MPRPQLIRPAAVHLDASLDDRPGELLLHWLRQAEWLDYAACGDSDPSLFFVEGSSSDRESLGSRLALAAYELCAGCPVRPDCLDAALESESSGAWGGTSEADRRAVADLDRATAIDVLEAGLDERLRVRREAQLSARRARIETRSGE